ncbi:MAG TPA: ribonuclease HI [Candidatus Paceibacterota bacterium]
MVIIFTDGSSRGNPGSGGWGAIVAGEDTVFELGGGEGNTTNNRMELTAVISGLVSVPNEKEVTVFTDSAYVVNGITRWVKGWEANNWKTSQKEDVLNRDLWESLVDAVAHRVVHWKLLKGHSGNHGNERCDVIATSFADKNPVMLYSGSSERYGVDLSVTNLKSDKKSKSKSKAYSYISMVDGEIVVHKTWEECKKRVMGVPKARFKKSTSPADEEEIIREFTE